MIKKFNEYNESIKEVKNWYNNLNPDEMEKLRQEADIEEIEPETHEFYEWIKKIRFDKKNEKYTGVQMYDYLIPQEAIDDQFLRLEEVFNCDVKWNYCASGYRVDMVVRLEDTGKFGEPFPNDIVGRNLSLKNHRKEIVGELNQIKKRIELMYPVKMKIKEIPIPITTKFMITILPDNE